MSVESGQFVVRWHHTVEKDDATGVIKIDEWGTLGGKPMDEVRRSYLATKEESVRAALIALGWTPPEKTQELKAVAEMAARLPTGQDCPVENHGIVVAAMDALEGLPL